MKNKNESMWAKPLMTVALLLVFCAIRTTSAQTGPEIAEKALAATVYLEMKDSSNRPLGFGSGFFVKPNLIATNYHVIAGAVSGTAKVVGKYTIYKKIEGITATDKDNDLALLKVMAYGIKPLPLGNSDAVKVGEEVYVAGNPMGLEGTFSDGIISRLRAGDTKDRLQMTAPISPGSSGGPVLNNRGKVIGVSVAAHGGVDAQNLNFAIPSNSLKRLLARTARDKPSWDGNTVSAETYYLRGNALDDLELYEAAIEAYTQAIHLEPNHAYAYNNRGIVKAKLGQYFVAISDFDRAIHLKPHFAEAYNNRGIAKAKLGQHAAAINDFNEAIRLEPNHAGSYYNRGNAKAKLGQHFEAISDYDAAIRLKPDLAKAYRNRGVVKAQLGQHFAAISDYDAAIRLKSDDARAYLNRGLAKGALGQYATAISDYDEAIRLKPDYADAYYGRGLEKVLLGRKWEAKRDFRTAWRLAEQAGDADLKARAERKLRMIQ